MDVQEYVKVGGDVCGNQTPVSQCDPEIRKDQDIDGKNIPHMKAVWNLGFYVDENLK